MTVEQRVKILIGELHLTVLTLQTQLAEAQKKIAELEAEKDKRQE